MSAAAATASKGVPGAAPTAGDAQAHSRHSLLLAVCCLAQFMVILDVSIVNVALPSIHASLGFSQAQLQWVVNAYTITFAGFLMLSGRAADLFGQRRTFVVGLLLFALASLAGGTAISQGALIGARALQGIGGAVMAAASLAIITSSFPPGPERFRAIGLWGAMAGAGGAAGTLLGGIITQELSWRWVLLINLPIGIAGALAARVVVSERRRKGALSDFDLGGALAITAGMLALVYGIVNAGSEGWGAFDALGPILLGVALLSVFVLIEARIARAPIVPLRVFSAKPLRVANAVVLVFSAALFPMWYFTSLYLQEVLRMPPLGAGLAFLPMALTIMACASRAGALVTRVGVRPVLGVGLTLMAIGFVLFGVLIEVNGSYGANVLLPSLFVSTGIGFSVVPSTIAATAGAKPNETGLVSGLVNTSRQMGGALGLAILASVSTQFTSHLIGTDFRSPLLALTDGFRLAYLLGGAFAALAALLTFRLIPKLPARPHAAGAGESGAPGGAGSAPPPALRPVADPQLKSVVANTRGNGSPRASAVRPPAEGAPAPFAAHDGSGQDARDAPSERERDGASRRHPARSALPLLSAVVFSVSGTERHWPLGGGSMTVRVADAEQRARREH